MTRIRRTWLTVVLTSGLLLAFALAGGLGTVSAGARPAANGLGNLCDRLPSLCRTVTSTATAWTTQTQLTGSAVQTVTTAQSTQTVTTRVLFPNLCRNLPFICRTATATVTRTTQVWTATATVTVTQQVATVTTTVRRTIGDLFAR
jgi:hypothetical protein